MPVTYQACHKRSGSRWMKNLDTDNDFETKYAGTREMAHRVESVRLLREPKCVCVQHACLDPVEGIGPPGAAITDGCKPPRGC